MGSESEIFPWLVTDPELWVRPTERSEINTKTTKRLPTRRPIISFITLPISQLVTRKEVLAMMRDFREFSINSFSVSRRVTFGSYCATFWSRASSSPSSPQTSNAQETGHFDVIVRVRVKSRLPCRVIFPARSNMHVLVSVVC
jgi:hypothetical protein